MVPEIVSAAHEEEKGGAAAVQPRDGSEEAEQIWESCCVWDLALPLRSVHVQIKCRKSCISPVLRVGISASLMIRSGSNKLKKSQVYPAGYAKKIFSEHMTYKAGGNLMLRFRSQPNHFGTLQAANECRLRVTLQALERRTDEAILSGKQAGKDECHIIPS